MTENNEIKLKFFDIVSGVNLAYKAYKIDH